MVLEPGFPHTPIFVPYHSNIEVTQKALELYKVTGTKKGAWKGVVLPGRSLVALMDPSAFLKHGSSMGPS